jgi:hypothetical protein
MSDTTRPKPVTPTVTYHRDTDTLSVSLTHRECEGVSSVTSSYMTQLEMSPAKWRAYLAAVLAKVDEVAPEPPIGPQQFVPHDLAGRIAEHAAAT